MKKIKWIGKGISNLIEGSPNLNVINIVRSLVEDENCICYIPFNYAIERKTSKDPKIHFTPTEAGKSILVTNIQSNKERFNFSLTGEVDVYVEYENEDGTVELKPKKIFRTYTIIRDGELTLDYLACKLSKETFNDLRNAGMLYYNGVKVPENHHHVPEFIYKVKLTDIPLLSYAWAQPQQLNLFENLDLENKLANTLTSVNSKIKEYTEAGQQVIPSDTDSIYYNEGWFGDDRVGDKKNCKCIIWEVKNDKEVLNEYLEKCVDINTATIVKREINSELRNLRFINRCITYAMEKHATPTAINWSEKTLVPRSKEKYAQTASVPGLGRMYELKRTEYYKEF